MSRVKWAVKDIVNHLNFQQNKYIKCKKLFFLCGFVRVGCGVVQRVAARQTCLCSDKCAELLRNDENILKSSAQTSLADALNLSSKPAVFCPFIPLFGLLSPAVAVQPPASST